MKSSMRIGQWLLTGLIFMVFCGGSALAGVELELPKNITAVAVNGQNTKFEETVSLPDGVNQVVVQFQGELGRGQYDDDAEMGYSEVFVVKFTARNQSLKMVTPRIKSVLDLEAFNRDADIRILDNAGRSIDSQKAKLEIDGFQLFRNYENELKTFNQTDSPAAVSLYQPVSSSPVSKGSESASTVVSAAVQPASGSKQTGSVTQKSSGDMAEKMLKYWYQQADEATRERFKRWINQ